MHVKMILPALTEATSPFWRPIKYSLFPPLGLATLAGYLPDDEVALQDEHVETPGPGRHARPGGDPGLHHLGPARLCDGRPLPAPGRARLPGRPARHLAARGGSPARRHHLPRPGRRHLAPFPGRLPGRAARRVYRSTVRTLEHLPPSPRPDQAPSLPGAQLHRRLARLPAPLRLLLQGRLLWRRALSFYTQRVDAALAEIERLPGRHLYFLDDHLFGDPRFAAALFEGMRGMGRLWQAAGRSTRCFGLA